MPARGRHIPAQVLAALWSAYEQDGWKDLVSALCRRLRAHRERSAEGMRSRRRGLTRALFSIEFPD